MTDAIAKLETFTNEFVCFVKLTTQSGKFGWGQTSTYNADISATIFHRQVAPWALGADSADILGLVNRIEEREHKYPGSYRCRALAQERGQAGCGIARRKTRKTQGLCIFDEAGYFARGRGEAVYAAARRAGL